MNRLAATNRPWFIPTLLGIITMLVAATGSWVPSLWGDEGTSVLSAQRSWSSLLRMTQHVDAVHGVYYAGLHLWVDIFGASAFSVRFPSAVATGVATAAVVLIVRELAGTRLALLAGIVCCTLPRITYAGEEARSYAFSAALAGWTLWVLIRLLTGQASGCRWWVTYVALLTVSIWVFLFSALLLAVHAVIIASVRPQRRFIRRWGGAVLITMVLVSPIAVAGATESSQIAFLAHRTTVTFTSLTVGLWLSSASYASLAWALIVLALVGAIAGVLHHRPRSIPAGTPGRSTARALPPVSLTVVAAAWLLVPVTLLVLANLVHPVFSGRYMTSSAPAAAILMALGLDRLGQLVRRPVVVAIVGAVVITGVAAPVWLQQRGPHAKNDSDWADISQTIGSHASAGDAVVFDESTRPSRNPRLALHTYPAGFRNVRDVTLETPYWRRDTWRDSAYTPAEAAARGRFGGVTRVWLAEYAIKGRADTYGAADLARLGYKPVRTFHEHRSTVTEYQLDR
ncbi:glycosyltransferase family 39 protein [Curtobacterium sp. UNCCL17]|uniref:glycosyltransferase family 39 protein n=1 Tax=Curtobacterium sp. UNCCL17 TaxID=1449051 RepID=UPI0009DF7A11|nr:glycosyltransferase family 39 protein [Curtobacterium sp. UNCCL17]